MKILKKGGGVVGKREEEETKSMLHAPVNSLSQFWRNYTSQPIYASVTLLLRIFKLCSKGVFIALNDHVILS